MTQVEKVIEKKVGLTDQNSEYVAVFADGTVSEVLTQGTIPHPSEGQFVRIFKDDNEDDIQAKLGSIL